MKGLPNMKPTHKFILLPVAAIIAVVVITAILKIVFVDFVVDFWWFQSQEMGLYFIMRAIYRFLVFALFAMVFFVFFYVNFWIASRAISAGKDSTDKDSKNLVKTLHDGLRRFYLPFSILMALPIAFPMFTHWEKALMFLFGSDSGVVDPLLGKDVSFYLFSVPVYALIQKEIMIAAVILLLGVMFLYWYEGRLLAVNDQTLPRSTRLHVSLLALVIVAIIGWGLLLDRYNLLYETVNLPVFYGPGYVEMKIILPLIWLSVIFLAATGVAIVVSINRNKGWKLPLILGVLFIVCIAGKNVDGVNNLVRKYIVAPNQLVRERPYITANIRSTLSAFDLDNVQIQDFQTKAVPDFDADDPALVRRLQNIPVWDREMLGNVYEELQGFRTYYSFPTIDVDRYEVQGTHRQVYLGAREIQFTKLPQGAQNWINLHLQYTHGLGVVMIPAAQAGDEFMTWFIRDIPPRSDYGLPSNRNSIYYGLEDKHYAIVPNDSGEIGSPVGEEETIVHYTGTGGVPISSLWRKLLFSLYFDEKNIFFTAKTNDRSRMLFRRNIIDAITHATPFLTMDEDPYIVSTTEGLFWIQDAYTTADRYPLVSAQEEGFNYIRNSVKIVVDAYHGKISFYIADDDDPIINAYRRMYPGVFQPLDKMPAELRKHIRYPRDIFHTQVNIYATYHQKDPERFYRQEDIWEFSKVPQGRELVPAKPYYLTLDLIEPGKDDFLLFMPMSPFGRDNLRALMIAGSDGDNYGKIFAYRFPRGQQVNGPAQVHSLVNQDVIISEQFTLWDQEGSEVIVGKMVIEPTGGSLLYIQPVYLQEEGRLKIPQLKRLIMSLDNAVVMAESLEEAAVKLEAELARKSNRRTRPKPEEYTPQEPDVLPAGQSTPPLPAGDDQQSVTSSPPKAPDANRPKEPSADKP